MHTSRKCALAELPLHQALFSAAPETIDLQAKVLTAETQDIIGQYILFCRVLDSQTQRLGPAKEAAEEAIQICQDRGVMTESLEDRRKEVIESMIMLFDQEYAVRQFGKEQRSEGREEGRKEGMLEMLGQLVQDGSLSLSAASRKASMSEETFRTWMHIHEAENPVPLSK